MGGGRWVTNISSVIIQKNLQKPEARQVNGTNHNNQPSGGQRPTTTTTVAMIERGTQRAIGYTFFWLSVRGMVHNNNVFFSRRRAL
jgi:hypothetical protein